MHSTWPERGVDGLAYLYARDLDLRCAAGGSRIRDKKSTTHSAQCTLACNGQWPRLSPESDRGASATLGRPRPRPRANSSIALALAGPPASGDMCPWSSEIRQHGLHWASPPSDVEDRTFRLARSMRPTAAHLPVPNGSQAGSTPGRPQECSGGYARQEQSGQEPRRPLGGGPATPPPAANNNRSHARRLTRRFMSPLA